MPPSSNPLINTLALTALGLPALAFVILGFMMLIFEKPSERLIKRTVGAALLGVLGCSLACIWLRWGDSHPLQIHFGEWFHTGSYGFEVSILLDSLSMAFMVLTASVSGLIGRFSFTYMHRESGFARFFLLLLLFAWGMLLLVMAGNADLLFIGWEFVGLSSALLIGFFHEREEPVQNGLRAFVTYRVCDIGLAVGAMLLHHFGRAGDFTSPFGATTWPLSTDHLETGKASAIAFAFVIAAIGKSAQLPACGWLPRAMEGPTPSSALFYGALSVHGGAYLLLRTAPLLRQVPLAAATVVAIGGATAFYATLVGRVQSDAKNELAYATMTQVGLIFVEIGLGLYRLALLHLIGHACVRTYQLLRAPNVLHEFHHLHAAAGKTHLATGLHYERLLPTRLRTSLYWLALERFHLDALVNRYLAEPVVKMGAALEMAEDRLLATAHDSDSKVASSDDKKRESTHPKIVTASAYSDGPP